MCVLPISPALVRPVKALKVWPGLAPEQRSLSPSLSCGGLGGQVRKPLASRSEDVSWQRQLLS